MISFKVAEILIKRNEQLQVREIWKYIYGEILFKNFKNKSEIMACAGQ